MRTKLIFRIAAAIAAGVFAASVGAKTLTWALLSDANSLDPHARDETFTLGFPGNVYEGLVARGPNRKIFRHLR